MSGYPATDPFSGYPQRSGGNLPPDQFFPSKNGTATSPSYPPTSQPYPQISIPSSQPYPQINIPPSSPSNPYPSQTSYPSPQQTSDMSGNNVQVAPGYPPASGYPGYPNSGNYPSSGGHPNTGGYPNTGGFPNTGGYPDTSAVSPPGFNPQVCPTAPDLGSMQKIPGYERLTFDEEIVMPPSVPEWQPEIQDRKPLENFPTLTEEEVREALIQYTAEHCCYGSGAAKNMVITGITMMSAFHYKLETFGEKRESAWRFEPYHGQSIDGPMNGPAPRPWDIAATPPALFRDGKIKMEVPHTAFIKPCHTCVGNGRVRCEECNGAGSKDCTWCRGRGVRSNFDNERCTSCEGTGRSRCTWCEATGQVKCKTCNGKGQLKGFVELIITWTNHVDDYISETSNMPKELVREVSGQVALEEEHPRVYPIMHAPDQAVRNASNEFVNKHNTAFPNERIIKQRHCLRLIPIGEVGYMWKEKSGMYYVYGYEHKVYFKKYPQKCCCCTII